MVIISLLLLLINNKPIGHASYLQQTTLDGTYYSHRDGDVSLLFTETESIYVHEGIPSKAGHLINEEGLPVPYAGDAEGFPIYKGNDKLVFKVELLFSTNCVIEDTIPRIDWKLQPDETRQIGKYTCRKAVGIYGGRVYDAWFTPEIPVPHGPYKLGGLPGLILEAHSRDGKVSFHFKSFEWVEQSPRAIIPPQAKVMLTSPAKFDETYEVFRQKYQEMSNARSVASGLNGSITIGKRVSFGDDRIEKY